MLKLKEIKKLFKLENKESEGLEIHHTKGGKNPETTIISRKEHQKIHGTIVINTDLSKIMRQYDALVKMSVMQQNWLKFHRIDFSETPDIGLDKTLELKRKKILEAKKIVRADLLKVKHIKGFGPRFLAGILAYADPNRFPSLRKFLHYCGYKSSSRKTKKYNRKVCGLVGRLTISVIMKKDKKYYSLYRKIKADLEKKNPNYTKGKIDGMAKNRVTTFLLKEIYNLYNADLKHSSVIGWRTGRNFNSIKRGLIPKSPSSPQT